MLSKSRYLKGLKCTKALWLDKFKKEEAFYSESTKEIFNQGNNAGELAQNYFPNGVLALVENYADSKSLAKTKALIESGVSTIYEATFAAENTLVAVDILHQIDGRWHAFEVKSTNSIKNEHIRDAAIQYYVMTNAGIEIEDVHIMHFDRSYVRNGEIVPTQLFRYESVFERMQPFLRDIPGNIDKFLEIYQQEEPIVEIGEQCNAPYPCEFAQYCHSLPENQSILDAITEAPILSSEVNYIDKNAITDFLNEQSYPIYSFDFETVMFGIPEFDNSRPYQQIPYQYSLHYQKDANSSPEHFEFLGNGIDDPREQLIQQLISDLHNEGKILVYSQSFDKTVMRNLMRDFPKYEEPLQLILDRMVDLLPIFKKYVKTERTQKSASLKIVLPTFLPHLNYEVLEISNGMEAMDAYKVLGQLTDEKLANKRSEMLEYCALDTYAVLALYNLSSINNF